METSKELYPSSPLEKTIIIKIKDDHFVFPVERINYCEAQGSYSKLHFVDGSFAILCKTLVTIEKYLKESHFIRCHRSFLVNGIKVEKMNRRKRELSISSHSIPVSRRRWNKTILELKALNDPFYKKSI